MPFRSVQRRLLGKAQTVVEVPRIVVFGANNQVLSRTHAEHHRDEMKVLESLNSVVADR